MLVSKTSRYALQAATHLAECWMDDEAARAGEIAVQTGIPKNYLSKILHQLARQGVCVSERGRNGGFRLARDPAKITLAAVVETVEPGLSEQHCILGRPRCSDRNPCLAHTSWKSLSEDLRRFLNETSLADLAQHE